MTLIKQANILYFIIEKKSHRSKKFLSLSRFRTENKFEEENMILEGRLLISILVSFPTLGF